MGFSRRRTARGLWSQASASLTSRRKFDHGRISTRDWPTSKILQPRKRNPAIFARLQIPNDRRQCPLRRKSPWMSNRRTIFDYGGFLVRIEVTYEIPTCVEFVVGMWIVDGLQRFAHFVEFPAICAQFVEKSAQIVENHNLVESECLPNTQYAGLDDAVTVANANRRTMNRKPGHSLSVRSSALSEFLPPLPF